MPKKVTNGLTTLFVKSAPVGRHADGGGLYLLVKESGARSWVYRFMLNKRSRDVGLGSAAGAGSLTLARARDRAAELRVQVKSGTDPLAERERLSREVSAQAEAERLATVTFKKVAESYIEENEATWRNPKHRQQWRNSLETYAYPVIGDLPISKVTTTEILQILKPIWRSKSETASRVRGRIETVLDSAKAQGFRGGENPARWRGHIALILPPRAKLSRGHHKAMPFKDIPAFIAALHSRQACAALALEFTILTAARSGEVTGATWSEVDLPNALWTVPANRMKAAKEHRVPLTARAIEILETVRPLGGDHLFVGAKRQPLSGMAMPQLLKRMDIDATVHGFRSGFRDWVAECSDFPHEAAELALAHTIDSKVERAYRRGDMLGKRRELMDAWSNYCFA